MKRSTRNFRFRWREGLTAYQERRTWCWWMRSKEFTGTLRVWKVLWKCTRRRRNAMRIFMPMTISRRPCRYNLPTVIWRQKISRGFVKLILLRNWSFGIKSWWMSIIGGCAFNFSGGSAGINPWREWNFPLSIGVVRRKSWRGCTMSFRRKSSCFSKLPQEWERRCPRFIRQSGLSVRGWLRKFSI